jgi:dienelactone hydrolase
MVRMTTPYGAWPSPLTAAVVTAGSVSLSWPALVGEEVWWTEGRPAEAGRSTVVRRLADGSVEDVLPPPWNARTRIHEYGGRAWTVVAGDLVFSNFGDQRLWRLTPGGEPVALTPEPDEPAGARYGELTVVGDELWCVRELHRTGTVTRAVVAVPLDGSGAVRELLSGADFLAYPRLSPDGRHLAVIAWNHPQMPWDGTELWVAPVVDGTVGQPRTVLGSKAESVLQPQWLDDETLVAISDRSGWWGLVRVGLDGTTAPILKTEEEVGGPLWVLGSTWFARLDDGSFLVTPASGPAVVAPDGSRCPLQAPFTSWQGLQTDGARTVAVAASPTALPAIVLLEPDGTYEVVHESAEVPVGAQWLPVPERRTFSSAGGRVVHAVVWPPTSPVAQSPDHELPPYVVFVHGGPTSQTSASLDLQKAYFTSRGIGIIDVDYGGSTGYGRPYRSSLDGQWGIVDVEDCVAAAHGLVAAGIADGARLAIRGGSAGGWTVLAALTGTTTFAAGASYFGVADLLRLAQDTHDFESRYLDRLVGPLPEALEVYQLRSPLNRVDQLSCPVLLLQGEDDEVVPPSQAEMFRDAMVRKEIPHAYLLFEGEGHGFRKAQNIVTALESELSFYGQVLGFDPPDVPKLTLER